MPMAPRCKVRSSARGSEHLSWEAVVIQNFSAIKTFGMSVSLKSGCQNFPGVRGWLESAAGFVQPVSCSCSLGERSARWRVLSAVLGLGGTVTLVSCSCSLGERSARRSVPSRVLGLGGTVTPVSCSCSLGECSAWWSGLTGVLGLSGTVTLSGLCHPAAAPCGGCASFPTCWAGAMEVSARGCTEEAAFPHPSAHSDGALSVLQSVTQTRQFFKPDLFPVFHNSSVSGFLMVRSVPAGFVCFRDQRVSIRSTGGRGESECAYDACCFSLHSESAGLRLMFSVFIAYRCSEVRPEVCECLLRVV